MTKISKLLGYAFISALLIYGCKNNMTVDDALISWAKRINESCPIMMENSMRMDSVEALPKSTFRYNYTFVTLLKADIDLPEFETRMETIITKEVHSNPELEVFREKNVTMQYLYRDMNGEFFLQIEVSPEEYKQ